MTVVWAVVGGLLVLFAWRSVLGTLVVPRRSYDRLSTMINKSVGGFFRFLTSRVHSNERRDRLLTWLAATIIVTQLAAWLAVFFTGFALIINALDSRSVSHAFAQAGSSLFTLGYAGPAGATLTVVDYFAAATGLIVVALQIGYLHRSPSSSRNHSRCLASERRGAAVASIRSSIRGSEPTSSSA